VDLTVVACGAAANVALNILLIPRYGLVGAATSTLTAEGIVLIGAFAGFLATQSRPALVATSDLRADAGA
jgi:O-antigen/teichoic acid export membrane protein